MFPFRRNPSQPSKNREEPWLAASLRPENFLPGLVIGFLLGLFIDLTASNRSSSKGKSSFPSGKHQSVVSCGNGEELKMVLIVRQDLRMGAGKIASQCAHAATGMYAEMSQSHRSLLRQWEQCGQPKIVLSCKNQQEMNKMKETADRCGLPTFVVSDAGRTQVQAGSRTVLAIGPGRKADIDSVTGKLRLL
ncbi:probable peptidyl-tRNA hydrolase 2 isoform X2 [Phoenix dactylifera]|uniref:peptidyl-tRNA hydrolase n=1 Tax=Phoenix dactylifera TaxID=42345 RepID=A0A8B8JA99_PHODC|nr:probable peptidyl-tRNA hydrolase 2 isoform X2 [Phoenix dactylifera]XP_026664554.2 probable peptidyl-tRNA hydrolase 2 isoform X2 [Phoenix dactylifera]XP_026664555.2 probable peptidyl-tRNA hydrolase 2 isoform X2 [Phoenix dactylifera]